MDKTEQEEEIAQTRKKISVLKKAILKQRQEKQGDLEQVDKLQKKINILDQILQQKNSQIDTLNTQKQQLQAQLIQVRQRNRQAGIQPLPSKPSKKSIAMLQQQNKKLLQDYHFLKQQNADLQNMFQTINQEYQQIQSVVRNKDDSLRKAVQDLNLTLADALRQQESLQNDLRDAQNSHTLLQQTNQKLQSQLKASTSLLQAAEQEIQSIDRAIQEKQGVIASLNQTLLRHAETEAKLSSKLMQYKNELADSENYYQRHEVIKINNLINHPAVITLKRDHTGDFVIEVQERRNKVVYSIRMIDSIFPHPNSESRFYVRFIDGLLMEFQSDEAGTLINKIRNFLLKSTSTQ